MTSPEPPQPLDVNGAQVYAGFLDAEAQVRLLDQARAVVAAAPLFHPVTKRDKQMSVQMTSAGAFGWVSDRRGYRYEPVHPSGVAWPPIPAEALALWEALLPGHRKPECCLINYYTRDARMGLHQDRDEADFAHPVLSISLGDDALFRVGGSERGGKTQSVWLASGDVVILSGAARMAFHGIDRLRAGSSRLLRQGGRLNFTLRVVT